jgi:ABC-type sugar transport system ATPase subunit
LSFAGFTVPIERPDGVGAGRVIVGIRPQDFQEADGSGLPTIEVEPEVVEDLGSSALAIFALDAPPVDVEAVRAASDEDETALLIADDNRALFTAELGDTTAARQGKTLRLAVDPRRFHYFDPDTGANLRLGRVAATAS